MRADVDGGSAAQTIDTVPRPARAHQGRPAGVVTRLLANAIDFGLLLVALGSTYAAWAAWRFLRDGSRFRFPTVPSGVAYLVGSIALAAYLTASWVATGRTRGDHIMGLRVVDDSGRPLGRPRALVRAALCVLFPVGLFWAVLSKRNRSLQDLAVRSAVIYDWRERSSSYDGHDPLRVGVDVQGPVPDEAHERQTQPLTRLDGQ